MRFTASPKVKISVLIACYTAAAFAVLGGFARVCHLRAEHYENLASEGYRLTFSEMASQLSAIDTTLQKSLYSGAPELMTEQLERLSATLTTLSEGVREAERTAGGGALTEDGLKEHLGRLRRVTPADVGPFQASGIPGKRAKLLEGYGEITKSEAAAAASGFLELPMNRLRYAGARHEQGQPPVYVFTGGTTGAPVEITIAKTGGFIVGIKSSRIPKTNGLPPDEAVKLAGSFLKSAGFRNMRMTRYVTDDKILHIQFAHVKDGVVFYPDEISVSVGRDGGGITELNSIGYIMNYHNREMPSPQISEEDARAALSSRLNVLSHGMAVVPGDGGEIYCHEFRCESDTGRQCLVHINAETGAEENILLVRRSEDSLEII